MSVDVPIRLDERSYQSIVAPRISRRVVVPIILDQQARQIVRRLKRLRGWSDSEIACRGIRLLGEAELLLEERGRPIVGLGEFASGIDDLGSEKGHLERFGR